MTMDDQPGLREAIEEAYATVTSPDIPLHALEIDHPAFDEPLRVIRWPVTGPEPTKFYCLHEDKAPKDPGRTVMYLGFPFELTLPESSANNEGSFRLKVAIADDFDKYLMEACGRQGVITAVYREYVKGRESEGPAVVWAGITITSPRREGADILADGTVLGWMRKAFGGLYRPIDYPALTAGR
jgi:hypothetical protein